MPLHRMDSLQTAIRDYVLDTFLPGVPAGELTEDTPLVSSGIVDSLATVRLVAYLEDHYGITVEPHEHGADYLDTVAQIASLVREKQQ